MKDVEYFLVYYNPNPPGMPLYLTQNGGFSVHAYLARVCKNPRELAQAKALVAPHGRPHWVESDWQP